MTKPTQRTHVFLIHAHKDRDKVRGLYARLVRDGIHAWLDAEQLQPGQDWQQEIRRAILKSQMVVVCLSRAFARQPGFRHEELKLALEKVRLLTDDIFLIPVRLEACEMPEMLRHLHRVDLFETGGYKKLLQVLKSNSSSRRLSAPAENEP